MTEYKKFNFMFLFPCMDIYTLLLYDARNLSNFRAVTIVLVGSQDGTELVFFTGDSSNNFPNPGKPETYSEWSARPFNDDFLVKNPICFVVYEAFYQDFKQLNFFQRLRDRYPDCKFVLWINNPIHTCQGVWGMFVDDADTKEILSTFDCAFTYNQKDAEDYGLTYFEGPYSVLPFHQPKETVDIFFVGQAKNRLEKIMRAYQSFKVAGFTCEFYITDVPTPPDLHLPTYTSMSTCLTQKYWSTSCAQGRSWT